MFTLPLAAAMLDETATPAEAFVDSIGVVTHLAYHDTAYGNRFDTVSERLLALGVHHVRDGVALGQTDVCAREKQLADHGIRFTYVTQPTLDARDLAAWTACTGSAIEAFEGPNEYDISHPAGDASWPQALRTFQQTLYDAVKADPAMEQLSVLGPSLTTPDAFRAVGDLSAYLDFGNMHDYFGGHEPGTQGWGAGGYGSIAYNVAAARAVSAAKPIVATETGFGTGTSAGDVPERVQAAYVPRLFLDHFAAGIARSFEYELLDEGPAPYDRFGLLRADLTPKPAYTALSSLIALLSDSAGTFRPLRFRYAIDGSEPMDAVRHRLFAKRDGRFYVALWAERPSIEPHTHVAYPVPPLHVHLRAEDRATLTPFICSEEDRFVPGPAAVQDVDVNLTDRVVVIQVTPAGWKR